MAIEKYFGLGESPINNLTKTKLTSQLSTCCCLETTSDLFPFFPDYFPVSPGIEIKISLYFFKNSRLYTNPGWNIPSFAKSDELDTLSASDFSSSSFLLPSKKFLKMTRISENFEYNKAEIKK